jgi:hypothetical protein
VASKITTYEFVSHNFKLNSRAKDLLFWLGSKRSALHVRVTVFNRGEGLTCQTACRACQAHDGQPRSPEWSARRFDLVRLGLEHAGGCLLRKFQLPAMR